MDTHEKLRQAKKRLFRDTAVLGLGGLFIVLVWRYTDSVVWPTGMLLFGVVLAKVVYFSRLHEIQCPHCGDQLMILDHSLLYFDRYRFCEGCGGPLKGDELPKTTTPTQRLTLSKRHTHFWIFVVLLSLCWVGVAILAFIELFPIYWILIAMGGFFLSNIGLYFYARYGLRCPACRGTTPFGSSFYHGRYVRCRHCQFCGAQMMEN